MKRTRKVVSTLVTMAMVGGLILPVAAPAMAYSKNSVSKVISIANDNELHDIGTITIREDSDYVGDFEAGDIFTLTLPSGTEWAEEDEIIADGADLTRVSDTKLELTIADTVDPDVQDKITITAQIKAKSSVNGDIKVKIDGKDSAVTSQELLIARALDGDTVTTVEDVETIGDGIGICGEVTIEEAALGSLGEDGDTKEIKLKLPANFDWVEDDTDISFSGSFDKGMTPDVEVKDRTMTITFDVERVAGSNQRGIIRITPAVKPQNDAKYGDVEINVSGDADDADVVVAKYADYAVTSSVKKVKELVSGRFEETTEEITIEEEVGGTLVADRKLTLTLPSWVKVTKVDITGDDFDIDEDTIDIDDNQIDLVIGTATDSDNAGELKFKLDLSIEADKAGDIEMTLGGKAGGEGSLVIAKAINPIKVEGTKSEVKIGAKAQPIKDIIITENVAGGITDEIDTLKGDEVKAADTELRVELPDNVEWNDYKVEVIEGNLEIDEDDIDTDADNVLVIPVKNESSKVSKIKISGITVDIDRTVPEGEITAKVKGTAVAQNYKTQYGWLNGQPETNDDDEFVGDDNRIDNGEFDTSTAAKAVVGTVITPANEAGTAAFNIGSTIYTAGGVTKVMDAAPYIKDGRTYVPVRYLALALGVSENDIAFENGVVTLTKGDAVIKLTIGSQSLMKNDATVQMDVAPEVVNGRTMLPARFVAEALGANVGFANGQVVISY